MTDDRRSPLVAQLVLLAVFAVLVAASIATVLVPELTDAGDEASEGAPARAR